MSAIQSFLRGVFDRSSTAVLPSNQESIAGSPVVHDFTARNFPRTFLTPNRQALFVSSFLSTLGPTTPDISVFLPDSGRCELAVRQRLSEELILGSPLGVV
jgi:hypothetical protein